MSHFFAYLSRMKFIKRWGLMKNTFEENILEHSGQVAIIAHVLAIISKTIYGQTVNTEQVLIYALYHDTSEIITGDLATPIKNYNPTIKKAYQEIELVAKKKIYQMIPKELQSDYNFFINESETSYEHKLVKAADKISALIKCIEELNAGNKEFSIAEKTILSALENSELPEVKYFMNTFLQSFYLSLDELD